MIRKDPWVRAVFLAAGVPLDSLAERILDIAYSEDPELMMERGLARWERILGLKPGPEATMQDRRSAVWQAWAGAGPPSVSTMQQVCDRWKPGAAAVTYDGRGTVQINLGKDDWTEADMNVLWRSLDRVKPAHLSKLLRVLTREEVPKRYGGTAGLFAAKNTLQIAGDDPAGYTVLADEDEEWLMDEEGILLFD